MNQDVRHDAPRRRFVIEVKRQEALLAYSQEGNVLDFYHTFVPEDLRGQGLAAKVVKAGFEYAKDKGLKVLATCPYVSGPFLKRHPSYRTLLADSP